MKKTQKTTPLESFTDIVDPLSIADILLVSAGFKPAALVEISQNKNSKKDFQEKIKQLQKELVALSLKSKIHPNYTRNSNVYTRHSIIAKNQKLIKVLARAEKEKNTHKRRTKTGLLLGYPRTAVNAFANNQSLDLDALPKNIKNKTEFRFLNFRLSQKNWKEELIYLKKKVALIKKQYPNFYGKIKAGKL
jgi:hypothetical protein